MFLFLLSLFFHRRDVVLGDPWVILGIFEAQSVFGIGFQESPHEVLEFRAEMLRVIKLKFPDLPDHVLTIKAIRKWRKPRCKLIRQHPKAPEIQSVIIIPMQSNLRTDIIRGTAISLSPLSRMRNMNGPAKISELNLIIDREQNVLWLDVAVDDII